MHSWPTRSPTPTRKSSSGCLASPHYGERWARLWLDLARYADTHGFEKDPRRTMWRYRDWVIDALNRDLPFDQFTVEQIAGDLLPDATLEQKIASGFHRNTMFNTEGGVDPEEARVATIVDRVNTTATVWLGTTLACAQCHSHKYDPFRQKEYYQFYSFFNNCDEPEIDAPTPEQAVELQRVRGEIAKLDAMLATPTPELEAEQAKWEKSMLDEEARWTVLDATGFLSSGGATLVKQSDKSLLATGVNASHDVYTVVATTNLQGITAVRLEVLPDASLPEGGLGRAGNGGFVLNRFELQASPLGSPKKLADVALSDATADFTEKGHAVASLISKKPGKGWAVRAGEKDFRVRRVAVFQTKSDISHKEGATLVFTLRHDSKWDSANVGRFRLSCTTSRRPVGAVGLPQPIATALAIPPDKRTPQQRAELSAYFRTIAPSLEGIRKQIAELRKQEPKITKALVLAERDQPRETHVLVRGNFLDPGRKVGPGVPAVLPPLPAGQPLNRLTLARWLVDKDNPLTPRVAVNRHWEQFFGTGLVATSEDFGTQGERPLHPELLDFLATELIRQKWSMKALDRLIVTSATYRQLSRTRSELLERDPRNRLLAAVRGPGSRPKWSATSRWPPADCFRARSAAKACFPTSPTASGRRTTRPKSGPRAKARTATAAACTPSGGARRRIRRSCRSTRPAASSVPCGARGPTRRCRRWRRSTTRPLSSAPGFGAADGERSEVRRHGREGDRGGPCRAWVSLVPGAAAAIGRNATAGGPVCSRTSTLSARPQRRSGADRRGRADGRNRGARRWFVARGRGAPWHGSRRQCRRRKRRIGRLDRGG